MAGNSYGRVFIITTYGESHGRGIGVVIDGAPSRIAVSRDEIQHELNRRRPGQSAVSTPRNEKDRVEILSGIFEGVTTGTPIALYIENEDWDSSAYTPYAHLFRPGHADYTYQKKYGIRDWRGSGRASGRETAARVAAGAIAKKILSQEGVTVTGYTKAIGTISAEKADFSFIEENIVRTADRQKAPDMIAYIKEARDQGDSVGGMVECVVRGVPAGWGDPVFDKLDALLAHSVLSIGAIKSFEVGSGQRASQMRGSEYNDSYYNDDGLVHTRTNNAGGILGGISTGEEIVIRASVRPPASIEMPQKTIDMEGKEKLITIHGRHDPCIVPRIIPVVEAMVAITLVDCMLIQRMYQ